MLLLPVNTHLNSQIRIDQMTVQTWSEAYASAANEADILLFN